MIADKLLVGIVAMGITYFMFIVLIFPIGPITTDTVYIVTDEPISNIRVFKEKPEDYEGSLLTVKVE